jgi:hypothetical protein
MKDDMQANEDIRQGVDFAKLRAFRAFAAENPDAVIFGLEASGTGEGRAVHTHATTGAYTLGGNRIDRIARHYDYHFGAHREVEEALGFVDPTDRPQETEVALAALSGCINAVVSISAAERGIDLQMLRTDVAVTWDPATFLHLADVEEDGRPIDQFTGLRVVLTVAGDGLCAHDLVFIRHTVKRSAVFNLLAIGREVVIDVRMADPLEQAA